MPGRRRFLVALELTGTVAHEVDGLRRGLASRDLERIGPHITLVPPINVADDALDEVVTHVDSVARESAPIAITLGPPGQFAGRDDVVFLQVRPSNELSDLQRALNAGVLSAPAARDRAFVPHVTLSTHCPVIRAKDALVVLESYRVEVEFFEVALFEQALEEPTRPWQAAGAFRLGRRDVVGRGGREVEFSVTSKLDVQAASWFEHTWSGYLDATYGTESTEDPFVIVARVDGGVVGVAIAKVAGAFWHLERLIVDPAQRGSGIGGQLLGYLERAVHDRGGTSITFVVRADSGAVAFYRSHGYRETARLDHWRRGRGFVVMERGVSS